MNCSNCGKEINKDSTYCGVCGTPTIAAQNEETQLLSETKSPNDATAVICKKVPTEEVQSEVKKDNIGQTILATFCSVAIFIAMLLGMFVLTVRSTIGTENIKSVVNEIDSSLLKQLVNEYAPENDCESKRNKALIKEVTSDSTIPKFIAEKIGEYGDYIKGGEKPDEIKKNEVVKLLNKNRNVSELMFDLSRYDRETERYENFYDYSVEPVLDDFYSNSTVDKIISMSRIFFSIWSFIILAIMTLAFAFILFKTREKKASALSWAGFTCTVTGVIYLLLFVIGFVITWTELLGEGTRGLLGILLESIAPDVLTIGGVILVVGIAMILVKRFLLKPETKNTNA